MNSVTAHELKRNVGSSYTKHGVRATRTHTKRGQCNSAFNTVVGATRMLIDIHGRLLDTSESHTLKCHFRACNVSAVTEI